MTELKKVALIGASRTPFARAFTDLSHMTNLSLSSDCLSHLIQIYGLENKHIDEVVGGAVLNHSRDFNLAREAALNAGLAPSTPGTSLQKACGTSLQAALMLGAKIATGEIESGIGFGVDMASDPPMVLNKKLSDKLVALSRTKKMRARLGLLKGLSMAHFKPVAPCVNEPRTGLSMGQHCELMAKEFGVTRQEQDELAFSSHQNAAKAYESGFMDSLIAPTQGLYRDNNVRFEPDLQQMAQLKPVFDTSQKGTLTAANSTPITDGAAAILLGCEAWAKANKLPIMGYLRIGATAANNFAAGDGLLMAPTLAVAKLMQKTSLSFDDFDHFEIHEAFAAQVLCTLKAFESQDYCQSILGLKTPLGVIDRTKLNIYGSSVAVGHPFAATGARILGVAAKLAQTKQKSRTLISVCTAGGMGVAAIVEGTDVHQ